MRSTASGFRGPLHFETTFKKFFWCLLPVILWITPAKADTQVIVRTTLGLQGLQQLCLLQNCSVTRSLGDPLNQVFLLTTPLDSTTLINALRLLPGIIDAEGDQVINLVSGLNLLPTPLPAGLMSDRSLVTSCGSSAQLWNSYANQSAATIVHVQDAHTQFCGAGVVADIDTGVDPNHPALAGVLLTGYDFTRNQSGASELNDLNPSDFPTYPPPACSSSTCPSAVTVNQSSAAILDQSSAAILDQNLRYSAFGHGTMVMGVIHLVAPKAMLLPLKAFRSDGTGYLSDILRAIYYAVQNGAYVINMSFDLTTSSAELASAMQYANQSSVIAAASAGNGGQKEIVYPAALQNFVMGVASTNDLDQRSSFSNFGNSIVWVAAPGEAIVTTYPFNTYAAGWGTSFSAPFVSGTASLLLSKQAKTNEAQAASAVAHAVPIGPDMGNGRLDIAQALQTVSPTDFSVAAAPPVAAISAGQTATYTVTLSPINGFNQSVALSCGGSPSSATCSVSPSAITLDGTNKATATITVQTTARSGTVPTSSANRSPGSGFEVQRFIWLASWLVGTLLIALLGTIRIPRLRPALSVLALLTTSLMLNSCGGAGSGGAGASSGSSQSSAVLNSVALSPSTIVGGASSTGIVGLSAPAANGGVSVSLSSSNANVAVVPANVVVPAGATNATFIATTRSVTASTTVTVSASSGTVTQTSSLTVTPPPPAGTPAGTYTLAITGTAGNLIHSTNVQLVVN